MIRKSAAAIAALMALGLGACSERQEMAANPKVCFEFKTTKPATAPATGAATAPAIAPPIAGAEGAAPLEDCVRKWAYALAPSRDEAGVVAEAAVAACNVQLSRWNQQSLGQPGSDIEANSLITGQPTTPIAEHSAFAGSRALLYVVQARAGRCAAPPITNGVPDGLS